MTEWITLRARFPKEEFDEIERIKEEYGISYNEIIRSGAKFYLTITLAKELVSMSVKELGLKKDGRDISELLLEPKYQSNLDQNISKLVKLVVMELFEKGLDFRERTRPIRKSRKVGRPKRQRGVGRPSSSR